MKETSKVGRKHWEILGSLPFEQVHMIGSRGQKPANKSILSLIINSRLGPRRIKAIMNSKMS